MRLKRYLIITLLLTFVIVLSGCVKVVDAIIDIGEAPEKYKSYVCYDVNLVALKTKGIKKHAVVDYALTESNFEDSYNVHFKKIAKESDEEFVSANLKLMVPFSSESKLLVLQNPDNYIDPWQDWTIEKIEIGYISTEHEDYEDLSGYITMREVVASTSDEQCISEIKELVLSTAEPKYDPKPEGYRRETDGKRIPRDLFCVKVVFKESKNIVWITDLKTFYSEELNDRIIYFDKGRAPSEGKKYTDIREYENLYNWLNEAIESES